MPKRFSSASAGTTKVRCRWAGSDPLYVAYHDREWGVPVHDDRKLFEMLILEGAQAGLSWITVLRKRENYRAAFDGFDPEKIASYGRRKIRQLLEDEGIIRNRLKIEAAIRNAQALLELRSGGRSFDTHLWSFVNGKTKQNARKSLRDIPPHTPESDAMSEDLKANGFKFVGSTICHAFMQAVGMVNDHTMDCFRHKMLRSA